MPIKLKEKDKAEYFVALLSIIWGLGLIFDNMSGSSQIIFVKPVWVYSTTFICVGTFHFISIGRNLYIKFFALLLQTFLWLFVAILFILSFEAATRAIVYLGVAAYCAYVMIKSSSKI